MNLLKINHRTFKIGKRHYFPKYSNILLLFCIFIFAYLYNYHHTLTKRPQGPHQWRQCDCLSITASYYHGDADFLHPRIYNLLNDNEGKTVSEFPIIYYTVAILWKIFGKHEWMFRLLNLLISIVGMILLLKMIEQRIRESFWSIFSVLVLFTSGIYVYYSLNFLSNTAAFNMALIGWYLFFRYHKKRKYTILISSLFFFLLAGLLKMSSAINFIALSVIFLLDWSGLIRFENSGNIFPKPLRYIIPAFIVVLIWIGWIYYASWYNSTGNSGVFLIGILPIWNLDSEQVHQIIDSIRHIWIYEYYHPKTQLLFIILLIIICISWKKSGKLLSTLTFLLTFAFISVSVLWFKTLSQHDYYVIDLLILSVFILFTVLNLAYATDTISRWMDSYLIKALAVLFLILNLNFTSNRNQNRFRGWMNERHQKEFYGYADLEPYLDTIGIGRDQKIISGNDPSVNITLYLMNRKGWNRFGTNLQDSLMVLQRIDEGASWLTVHKPLDSAEYSHWKYFIREKVGQHENVSIYRIEHPGKDKD